MGTRIYDGNGNLLEQSADAGDSPVSQQELATQNRRGFGVHLGDYIIVNARIDEPIALLTNPIASGKTFILNRFIYNVDTKGDVVDFKIILNPTILTNGTPIIPFSLALGDGGVSIATPFLAPTLTLPSGTELPEVNSGKDNGPIFFDVNRSWSLVPGATIAFLGNSNNGGTFVEIYAEWEEK